MWGGWRGLPSLAGHVARSSRVCEGQRVGRGQGRSISPRWLATVTGGPFFKGLRFRRGASSLHVKVLSVSVLVVRDRRCSLSCRRQCLSNLVLPLDVRLLKALATVSTLTEVLLTR